MELFLIFTLIFFGLVSFIILVVSLIFDVLTDNSQKSSQEKRENRQFNLGLTVITILLLLTALGSDLSLAYRNIDPSPQAHCNNPQEIQLAEVKNPIILDVSYSTPDLEYSKSFLTNNGETPEVETVSDIQYVSKDDLADGEKILHTALSNTRRESYYTLETHSDKNSITVTQCTMPQHPLRSIKDYTLGAGSRSTGTHSISIYTITVTGDKIPERK